jgi:hypothetical protein
MKGKWTIMISILVMLLLVLAVGLAWAQEPQPPAEGVQPQGIVSIQANLGTAFTYQGQLKKNGSPVNGTCDFLFSLWDAATEGNQIGPNQEKTNVPVTNGLFTVQLDFGANAFQGDARWLRVRVRCPAGSDDYIVLDPRQPLTPAPYALALPGLWTQQNNVSPNIIGGYSGNIVTSGVFAATIGGGGENGGENRVTDHYGTVGGGYRNRAGDNAGLTNDRLSATVSGGQYNIASGYSATVGGGDTNTASGYDATIGGGYYNTAWGSYATVPGGHSAAATHYGEMAYASGAFAANGDAQTSTYVMRIERICTFGIWYDLYLNGNNTPSEFVTIAEGRTVAFDALVVGRSNLGKSAGYYIRGVIENDDGEVSFIGTPVVTTLGEDDSAWNVQAVASDTFDALFIQVQGNGEEIRWVATVRTAEVSW